jgi:putative transposase
MNIVNKNNQQIYRHKSIRLKEYDYSQPGAYFVTVCTHNRASLFGKIIDGEMVLNDMGKIVGKCILDIPVHFSDVEIDKFVIMPNHVHLIIIIYPDRNSVGA